MQLAGHNTLSEIVIRFSPCFLMPPKFQTAFSTRLFATARKSGTIELSCDFVQKQGLVMNKEKLAKFGYIVAGGASFLWFFPEFNG